MTEVDQLRAQLNGALQAEAATRRERDAARTQRDEALTHAQLLKETLATRAAECDHYKEHVATLEQQVADLNVELAEDEEMIDGMGQVMCGVAFTCGQYEEHNARVLTEAACAYCGHVDPRTPEAMTAHASACEKHPLRAALAQVSALREALEKNVAVLDSHRITPAFPASHALANTAQAAAEHDARVRREALEEAAKLVDDAGYIDVVWDGEKNHEVPFGQRVRALAAQDAKGAR